MLNNKFSSFFCLSLFFLISYCFLISKVDAQSRARCEGDNIEFTKVKLIKKCLKKHENLCASKRSPLWCEIACDPVSVMESTEDPEFLRSMTSLAESLVNINVDCTCSGNTCSRSSVVEEDATSDLHNAPEVSAESNNDYTITHGDYHPSGTSSDSITYVDFVPSGSSSTPITYVDFVPSGSNSTPITHVDFVPSGSSTPITYVNFTPSGAESTPITYYNFNPQGGSSTEITYTNFVPQSNGAGQEIQYINFNPSGPDYGPIPRTNFYPRQNFFGGFIPRYNYYPVNSYFGGFNSCSFCSF